MLITVRKFGIFKFVNVHFVDEPVIVDVPDWDIMTYHTYKNWGEIKGYEKNKYLTTIIDLKQDIDVIWKRIKRQHKRQIRRAKEYGININVSNDYEEFHQIFAKYFKQKNYTDLLGSNILSSQFMQKYGILFTAEKQGKIIGGNFYFHDKHNACLAVSASQLNETEIENKKQYIFASSGANCYLHWKAMQYFKNRGVFNYDLGDVSSNDLNLSHRMNGGEYFKRSFGGDVISGYEYVKFSSRFNKLLFNSWNFLRKHA